MKFFNIFYFVAFALTLQFVSANGNEVPNTDASTGENSANEDDTTIGDVPSSVPTIDTIYPDNTLGETTPNGSSISGDSATPTVDGTANPTANPTATSDTTPVTTPATGDDAENSDDYGDSANVNQLDGENSDDGNVAGVNQLDNNEKSADEAAEPTQALDQEKKPEDASAVSTTAVAAGIAGAGAVAGAGVLFWMKRSKRQTLSAGMV